MSLIMQLWHIFLNKQFIGIRYSIMLLEEEKYTYMTQPSLSTELLFAPIYCKKLKFSRNKDNGICSIIMSPRPPTLLQQVGATKYDVYNKWGGGVYITLHLVATRLFIGRKPVEFSLEITYLHLGIPKKLNSVRNNQEIIQINNGIFIRAYQIHKFFGSVYQRNVIYTFLSSQ